MDAARRYIAHCCAADPLAHLAGQRLSANDCWRLLAEAILDAPADPLPKSIEHRQRIAASVRRVRAQGVAAGVLSFEFEQEAA